MQDSDINATPMTTRRRATGTTAPHDAVGLARRGIRPHLAAAAMLCIASAFALVTGAPSSARASTADTCVPTAPTTAWKPAVARANTALTAALTNLQHQKFRRARAHLHTVRHQTRIAHTAATALIGRPPTDPESDDPPGVAAVIGVSNFEHKVSTQLVPKFDGQKRPKLVHRLGNTLNTAVACRDVMLAKVIALKPGKRDDYVDDLSDSLGGYGKEKTAMSAALSGDDLTAAGRRFLTKALAVVTATNTAMQRVFGGGERSPAPPR